MDTAEIISNLAAEIGTKAPFLLARQYADTIAANAVRIYPRAPRWFAWLFIAVVDRETGWKNILGDNGHGHGLPQIDDRTWGKWLAANENGLNPLTAIPKGMEILADSLQTFYPNYRAGVAAYNCGAGNVRRSLKDSGGASPDLYTTGHNYGLDVLHRFRRFVPPGPLDPA